MANNSVDAVIGSEAIKQVENLISKLSLADAELIKISQSATSASKGISGISTPSGLDKSVSNTSALNSQLEKQNIIIANLQNQLQQLARAKQLATTQSNNLSKSIGNTNTATRENAISNQIARAEADRNFRANTLLAGAYAKASAQLVILKKEAKDAAIAYGENSRQAVFASKAASDLGARIKSADKSVGDYQRNVGNYAGGVVGGFKSIFSSVRQLAYILPGIGIAGIFNLAFDAILPLIEKMDLFKKKLTDSARSSELLNKSFEQTEIKDATKNINELSINIGLAKAGFLDKKKVVDQYNETIGKTTGLVSSLDEAEKELTKNADAYIKMTLYKAAANLALEEAAASALKAENARRKSLIEFQEKATESVLNANYVYGTANQNLNDDEAKITKLRKERKDAEIKINEEARDKNLSIAKKFQSDAAKIAKDFNFNLFGDTKAKKTKADKPEKREDLTVLENHLKTVGTLVSEINTEINRLTTEQIIANADELPAVNFQLEQLKLLKQQLNGLPTSDFKIAVPAHEAKEALKELTQEQKNYLNSFATEFASKTGFEETFNMLSNNIEGFGKDFKTTFVAIAESAQEVFNFINQNSESNFKAESDRLSAQKDIALKYAGDSAAAKTKIEEDFTKKQKELEYKQAKVKQRQAIFNIAIDTAQAVMATLGKTGFFGIPLSAVVASMGVAQIAMVASQKIPQYFNGTDNHVGGLMLVNDGAGSNFQEKVILPNGKEITPEGRNVLMNAPKGTKVLTHDQQIQQMLSERGVSMSKNYNSNNVMTSIEMDTILGKHFSKIQTNHTTFDKNGIQTWSENNGNKTIRNNARGAGTGFRI